MVNFEYKVVRINTFGGESNIGHITSSSIENEINKYAEEGWEYQNAIVSPTAQTRNCFYYTAAYLVFRRAKS